MNKKGILSIIVLLIFLTGSLSTIYADSGPTIGSNQAQKIAQKYLDTHGLHYKAISPSENDDRAKVKDSRTGKIIWVKYKDYVEDSSDFGGPGRYLWTPGHTLAWLVPIYNYHGKKVGTVYVESETGKVLSSNLKKHKITRHKHKIKKHKHVVKKPKYKVKKHKRQKHKVHKHKIKLRKH